MIGQRFAVLTALAALVGCGAGRTIRVSDTGDTPSEPVSLAPAPDAGSGAAAAPAPAETPAPAPAPVSPAPANAAPAAEQGYAPYGGDGSLEVRRIGQWSHTGIGEARRMVIRDANAWAQLWSELGTGDRPDVDFTQNVVVAVAAGERSSGGYEISVDRVNQADGQLTIEVVEVTPGPNCITTATVTQPVDVVVVPAVSPRGWSFMERKEIRSCR